MAAPEPELHGWLPPEIPWGEELLLTLATVYACVWVVRWCRSWAAQRQLSAQQYRRSVSPGAAYVLLFVYLVWATHWCLR